MQKRPKLLRPPAPLRPLRGHFPRKRGKKESEVRRQRFPPRPRAKARKHRKHGGGGPAEGRVGGSRGYAPDLLEVVKCAHAQQLRQRIKRGVSTMKAGSRSSSTTSRSTVMLRAPRFEGGDFIRIEKEVLGSSPPVRRRRHNDPQAQSTPDRRHCAWTRERRGRPPG